MARRRSKKVFRSPKLARRQARKRRSMISERRKKEFLWRGYNMEQLLELPLYPPEDDMEATCIATLMPSRAKRSLSRGLNLECENLLESIRSNDGEIVKTHCRSMYILPEMVGTTVGIHNGKDFVRVEIVPEMICNRLASSPTRASRLRTPAPASEQPVRHSTWR